MTLEELLAPNAGVTSSRARLASQFPSTGSSLPYLQELAKIFGSRPEPSPRLFGGSGGVDPGGLVPLLDRLTSKLPWLDITSGYRTEAEQAALYKQKPDLAAPPGHSYHETGKALDVHSEDIGRLVKWLANHPKFGNRIYRPMSYEPWHFQLKGER